MKDKIRKKLKSHSGESIGETLVALFNFAPFAQAGLPGEAGEYVDLWNGDVRRAEDVIVPGGGFRWMVKKSGVRS